MQQAGTYYDEKTFVPCNKIGIENGAQVFVTAAARRELKKKIDWDKYISKEPFISGDAQEFVNDLRSEDVTGIDWAKYARR